MAPARFAKSRVMERTREDSSRIVERTVETAAIGVGLFFVKGAADKSAALPAQGARAKGVTLESEAPRTGTGAGEGSWGAYGVGDFAWCVESTDQPVLVVSSAAAGTFSDGDKVTATAAGTAELSLTGDNVNGIVIEEIEAPDGTVYVRIEPTWLGSEVTA